MTRFATPILTSAKGIGIGAFVVAAFLQAPLAAQNMRDDEPDAEEIARTPLSDLNIDSKDIPEDLLIAEDNPYAAEGLVSCNALVAEIAKLDQVLGPDYDLVGKDDTGLSRGKAAQSVVGSFIPFRGLVREVSGAAGDARKVRAAVTAGLVRRGFLKGMGQQRGCAYPASPRAETLDAAEQQ